MRDGDPMVQPVESMTLPTYELNEGQPRWLWRNTHLEIAISTFKDNIESFGDSPHMSSVMNRAGIGVSAKEKVTLWNNTFLGIISDLLRKRRPSSAPCAYGFFCYFTTTKRTSQHSSRIL